MVNLISGEILSQLSSYDLKHELGIRPFGHRFIIMNAFQKVTNDLLFHSILIITFGTV